jgi:hypothetical protein
MAGDKRGGYFNTELEMYTSQEAEYTPLQEYEQQLGPLAQPPDPQEASPWTQGSPRHGTQDSPRHGTQDSPNGTQDSSGPGTARDSPRHIDVSPVSSVGEQDMET